MGAGIKGSTRADGPYLHASTTGKFEECVHEGELHSRGQYSDGAKYKLA